MKRRDIGSDLQKLVDQTRHDVAKEIRDQLFIYEEGARLVSGDGFSGEVKVPIGIVNAMLKKYLKSESTGKDE